MLHLLAFASCAAPMERCSHEVGMDRQAAAAKRMADGRQRRLAVAGRRCRQPDPAAAQGKRPGTRLIGWAPPHQTPRWFAARIWTRADGLADPLFTGKRRGSASYRRHEAAPSRLPQCRSQAGGRIADACHRAPRRDPPDSRITDSAAPNHENRQSSRGPRFGSHRPCCRSSALGFGAPARSSAGCASLPQAGKAACTETPQNQPPAC